MARILLKKAVSSKNINTCVVTTFVLILNEEVRVFVITQGNKYPETDQTFACNVVANVLQNPTFGISSVASRNNQTDNLSHVMEG